MMKSNKIALGDIVQQMVNWRHQIHRHPETAYTEFKTAKLVARVLRDAGIEVYQNIAVTGVVGILKSGTSKRKIALRADMDALHIQELNQVDYASTVDGKMHACGHDGHTAMLLGAAVYLASTRNLNGTIYFIFQPAEENEGGAQAMIEEGLFEKFPVDEIFGMHNMPSLPINSFSICSGPMMAAFSTFECTVEGKGTHSAMPETGLDPIPIAIKIHTAWAKFKDNFFDQTERVNLTVTQFNAGSTWNAIPDTAILKGSSRCFSEQIAKTLQENMKSIAENICVENGASCIFDFNMLYPPLINTNSQTNFAADAAASLVGEQKIERNMTAVAGSEDFAFMLKHKPGAYILIGNASDDHGGCMVHNAHYDFNDVILELGASYWITIAERSL